MSWRTGTVVLAALAAVLLSAPYEMPAVAQDQGDGPSPSVLSAFSGGAAEGKHGRPDEMSRSIVRQRVSVAASVLAASDD